MSDSLTILRARNGRLLAKRLTWAGDHWNTRAYDLAKLYGLQTVEVQGIEDLHRVLSNLERDPHCAVIRGAPLPATIEAHEKSGQVRRLLANFEDAPRTYAMFDIDAGVEAASADWVKDPEPALLEAIRDHFPPCFHGVSFSWQLSSSAGTKRTASIKAHLWFWLDRPVTNEHLKRWTKAEAMPVDPALFNAVQVHYTAAPVFEGAPDPLPIRSGFWQGSSASVHVPDLSSEVMKERAESAPMGQLELLNEPSVEAILATMGDGPGGEGLHQVVFAAVVKWSRVTHPRLWAQTREGLKAAIRAAAATAPWNKDRSAEYIAGELSDAALDRKINDVLTRARSRLIEHETNVQAAEGELAKLGEELPLEEAEARVKAEIEAWWKAAITEGTVTQSAVLAQVGLGKTEQFLRVAAAHPEDLAVKRVHYFVPDHTLSAELLERAKGHGIEARLYRGRLDERLGPTPCHPTMHRMAEAVEELGASVAEHVCPACPFRETCQWDKQQRDKAPGLIFMPNSYATLPSAARADATVFDEAFVFGLERHANVRLDRLDPANWPKMPPSQRFPRASLKTYEAEADLKDGREKLWAAMGGGSHIPTVSDLTLEGITAEQALHMKGLEYARHDAIGEALSGSEAWEARIAEAGKLHAEHSDAFSMARMWHSLEQQLRSIAEQPPGTARNALNGWRIFERAREGGGCDRVLEIGYRAEFRAAGKPALALDATGEERLLRLALPELDRVARVRAKAPHGRIVQVTDAKMGKRSLVPAPGDTEDTLREKASRRRRIVETVEALAHGRDAGLILYKEAEELLQAEGVPGHIKTGHFNNVRGRNDWRNAPVLVSAGRPMPKSHDLERLASALFFDAPEHIPQRGGEGQMGKAPAWHFVRGKEPVEAWREAHPNPLAEMVRRQITEAELVQSERLRLVRRGEADPGLWVILSNTPLPLQVDELVRLEDLEPSKVELATARLGVALANAAHLAAVVPELFGTVKAAEKALERAEVPDNLLIKNTYREMSGTSPLPVLYQRAGQGQRRARADFDLSRIPDPREWLEARFGPLARFELIELPAPATADPAPAVSAPVPPCPVATVRAPLQPKSALEVLPIFERPRVEAAASRLPAGSPFRSGAPSFAEWIELGERSGLLSMAQAAALRSWWRSLKSQPPEVQRAASRAKLQSELLALTALAQLMIERAAAPHNSLEAGKTYGTA